MSAARLAAALALALAASSPAWPAAGAQWPLAEIDADVGNRASLQRGARYFVNYCLSCHSAQYSRYNRVGRDLGMDDEMVKRNLIFTDQKVGDLMEVAMTPEEAMQWFGAQAPDLALVARSRGTAWLYTYLRSFYRDSSRPMGVNNALFQNVAMPHVLWELQGWQAPVYQEASPGNGPRLERLELVEPGALSPEEYDGVVKDIVTFLAYLAEPAAAKRKSVGVGVLLFLLAFLGVAWLLKREYWKDVDADGAGGDRG